MSDEPYDPQRHIRRLETHVRALEEQNAELKRQLGAGQGALWSREQLWGMFARERAERLRLLERNRKLTGKLLRRARVIGELRAGVVALIENASGAAIRPPE